MQNRFAEDSGVRRYKGKTRSNAPTISDNPHQCVRAAAQQFSPPVNGKQKRVGSRPDGAPVQRQSMAQGVMIERCLNNALNNISSTAPT